MMWFYVLFTLLIPGLISGCTASMKVFPEIQPPLHAPQVLLRGKILYQGNPEYLPRTVEESALDDSLSIRYTYDESQDRKIYFPEGIREAGAKTSTVIGTLEISKQNRIVKAYSATAVLSGETEYVRETLSQMRRRGLLAVRDNIESQMSIDHQLLHDLSPTSASIP